MQRSPPNMEEKNKCEAEYEKFNGAVPRSFMEKP